MMHAKSRASVSERHSTGISLRKKPRTARAIALVMASLCVVHSVQPVQATNAAPKNAQAISPGERAFTGKLPSNVEEMREHILAAVQSGSLSDLETAIEWNEIKPDFGEKAGTDPLTYLKTISADGEGRETLAALANILALPPARLAIGKDPENNTVFVWPYLAELPLGELKPGELVDLYRLVPPAVAKAMQEKKKWSWWRLAIGADGTWHTFRKYD